ncbi:MAG TPA: Na+/H+ antiporter subunit E [Acidimicrobiales bacterium]|nr:Na+/H+ antiporter subunit E [Acidimicrobiales bacterium]
MRHLGRATFLAVLWLLAWGQITVANITSGAIVAAVLLLSFPVATSVGRHQRLRPAGAARLCGYVIAQLVTSNLVMIREVLRRRPAPRPGVLAHRLREPSEEVITIMTSVIALSPGTMAVDVDERSTTVYVHFLLLDDIEAARATLVRLERLVVDTISRSDASWKGSP